MNKIIAGLAGVALMVTAGVAHADDIKGAITAVNGNTRNVTIDGQAYYFPRSVDMSGLNSGQTVTLTYTAINNRREVSKVTK